MTSRTDAGLNAGTNDAAVKGAGIATLALIMLVCAYAVLAWQRNLVWTDELTLWSDVTAKSPSKSRGYTYLGIAAARERDWPTAYEKMHRAVSLNPGDVEARFNLAALFADTGRHELAALELDAIVKQRPDLIEPYLALSDAYTELGRHNEAADVLESADRRWPYNVRVLLTLGAATARTGDHGKAMQTFHTVLALNPSESAALSGLGNIHLIAGRLDEAVRHYERALAVSPNDPDVLFNMALALEGASRPSEAAAHYERFLSAATATEESRGAYADAIRRANESLAYIAR